MPHLRASEAELRQHPAAEPCWASGWKPLPLWLDLHERWQRHPAAGRVPARAETALSRFRRGEVSDGFHRASLPCWDGHSLALKPSSTAVFSESSRSSGQATRLHTKPMHACLQSQRGSRLRPRAAPSFPPAKPSGQVQPRSWSGNSRFAPNPARHRSMRCSHGPSLRAPTLSKARWSLG